MLHNLSLATIANIDSGQAAAAFDASLRRAIQDCVQRPMEERVRKITLQAELTPSDGGDDIHVSFQIKETLPTFQTSVVKMQVRKQGHQLMLVFQQEDEEAA